MKVLKRRLLFVLASDVDIFETIESFSYWSYQMLYWRLSDFGKVSVRGGISGFIKSGEVAKIVRDGQPKFRLTAVGKDRLVALFNMDKIKKRWDKTWRVVILDRGVLNQSELRNLKLLLEEFGFVSLEVGVFVSPLASSEELKRRLIEKNLIRAITMMETKRFVVGDDRAFAAKIWGLDRIVQTYKNISSHSSELLKMMKSSKRLTRQQKDSYNKVYFDWFKLLLEAPGLPTKLLPNDWPHLEAMELMVKLGRAVRELEEESYL